MRLVNGSGRENLLYVHTCLSWSKAAQLVLQLALPLPGLSGDGVPSVLKTSLSTGALLSVGGRSLITVLGTVVLHLLISFVLFWFWRWRERTIVPPSLACLLA